MPTAPHTSAVVTTSPTIFDSIDLDFNVKDGVIGNGVVFCIDTTGSMHSKLSAVRSELVELLTRWGSSRRFNLVRFGSGTVQRWSEGMVDCTPAAIADADRWLSAGGTAGSSTDTRTALTAASIDAKTCGAASVCLVTDSLPTSVLSSSELRALPLPVHCVYPKESDLPPQPGLLAELQELAGVTGGSLTVANVGRRGCIERVAPVARTAPPARRWGRLGSQHSESPGSINPGVSGGKLCSVTAALRCDPLLDAPVLLFEGQDRDGWRFAYSAPGPPPHWGGSWSRFRSSRPQIRALERDALRSPSPPPSIAGVGLLGRRVLARRRSDGLFYEGTVTSEAATPGQFNVELQTNKQSKGYSDTEYQTTPVGELIALDDALRRHLLPGDCVLAPRGPNRPDYGPGIVLDGYERRKQSLEPSSLEETVEGNDKTESAIRPLAVAFTDGSSSVVEPGRAVRITHSLYHRLQLEAVMPKRERLALADWTSDYPEATRPGYLATRPVRVPDEYEAVRPVWPPNRMLPVPIRTRLTRSGSFDLGEFVGQSDSDDEVERDRSLNQRADRLIAEFDTRRVDAAVGPDAAATTPATKSNGMPKKSILKKPPPGPSKHRGSVANGVSSSTSGWASENGFGGGYTGYRANPTGPVRSANLYNRRPLEIGSCLGRGDLELESRRQRIDDHRRAASAERADALLRRRADVESAEAARLARLSRVRSAAVAEASEEQLRSGRRHVTAAMFNDSSPTRESRRRYVTPPTVPSEERPSRLRQVAPPSGDVGAVGSLQRSVRFSGSEPTVTAWIKRQDHMTPAEVRTSAQQLAARHKNCAAGFERQRWAAASAPVAAAKKTKTHSTKSKTTTSSSSTSKASKVAA